MRLTRHSAIDMENSENLLGDGPDSSVYNSRAKYVFVTCCLVSSYAVIFSLGFYGGYTSCDGSDSY